jgi:uncharacterized protein YjiK
VNFRHLLLAAALAVGISAHAADSLNLANYGVSATYGLDLVSGRVSGLEGSAVTYARDRGTLFFVGDEGTGVIEISRTGITLGSMVFDWTGTATTNQDTEGLTYLGGGVLVVAEERLYDAYRFSYVAGGTATLANGYVSISNAVVGNNGLEGISVDPRNGSFVTIKQQSPQDILAGTLTFAGGAGGVSTMTTLFNPALMGVTTLSDVQTLSPIDALAGTPAADNLLVLSLGSRRLIEVDRLGNVKSSFDLSSVLSHNAIEGVTVDEKGTIYLIAEQIQDGSNLPLDPNPKSQLILLTPAVPEPETYALMLIGLGALVLAVRRKRSAP